MITDHHVLALLVFLGVFAATAGVGGLFLTGLSGDHRRAAARLTDLSPSVSGKLQAGVNLNAALQRVTQEVQVVHPGLAREMNIMQREIQLGLSIGDAIMKFGERCDIDEVRNLAQIILQSERYGTSSVKALRLFSE